MRYIPKRKVEPVKLCSRCNLQTPEKQAACVHCSGLSEAQLQSFLENRRKEMEGNAVLGKYFLMGAVFIFFIIMLGALNN